MKENFIRIGGDARVPRCFKSANKFKSIQIYLWHKKYKYQWKKVK